MDLKDHIDRNIVLETKDGIRHEGSLYTVDPVSESVVLCTKVKGGPSIEIIFKHAIKTVINIGELNPMLPFEGEKINTDDLPDVRARLKNWLIRNMVPVEEVGESLKLAGQITINPPYGRDNCISSNEMVLSKVQSLIERMPFFE